MIPEYQSAFPAYEGPLVHGLASIRPGSRILRSAKHAKEVFPYLDGANSLLALAA